MRPAIFKNPTKLKQRMTLWLMPRLMGLKKPPEPIYFMAARPEIGDASFKLNALMHAPGSHWSMGARELMAAHVAARFQCPF